MRVILWIALVLTIVVTVSGQRSVWPWSRLGGMRNPRCISCSEVTEAHLCESCCKRPACTPNPCKNDGMCSTVDNGYNCSCTPGYLGENCDVNVCLPNPCKNNGTCLPVDKGYNCNCVTGYLGQNCDVNPCDIYNPCINNGRCYLSEFGLNCSCPPGLIGAFCQDSEGTTPVKEGRVCNETECSARGGNCFSFKCKTLATNCAGKACNKTNEEVCIDDTCVARNDICGLRDGTTCTDIGDKCGEGTFCLNDDKCVNDTCRNQCVGKNDGCNFINVAGTCKGGACLVQCNDEKDCRGFPCVGGYCASANCGESICLV